MYLQELQIDCKFTASHSLTISTTVQKVQAQSLEKIVEVNMRLKSVSFLQLYEAKKLCTSR